jgi:hypothetical protein
MTKLSKFFSTGSGALNPESIAAPASDLQRSLSAVGPVFLQDRGCGTVNRGCYLALYKRPESLAVNWMAPSES